jgi:antirestriction protein
MTLKEKIQSIDPDKTKSPVKVREFINKIEETANTSETKAIALIDGLIAKLTLENPNAIKSVTLTTEEAKRKLSKLKTLKAIVPKKADLQQIENQIRKQYPTWDNDKVTKLAQLRIDAQISRSESFNKLIDTLGTSQFYGAKELSTAQIDKGKSRSLEKDSQQLAITEADELKVQKKGVKPAKYKRISKAGAKNQYGTTKGGKVYYEYRMNRRDVDNKIRLENGGGVPNAEKMFHLPMEIAVYVPSTKNVDQNITATELRERVKEVEKYLAETFGGFTSSEKVGGYLSNKSSVVKEKVVPVTAFATKDAFEKNKSKLVNKLSVWAKKWSQEAIGLEFEGDLYYVPQKFKTGGTLKATYIPRRDIKMLTTIWGNNIKGKDLLDGAYTKRKNIKTQPKMVRSIFEEEEFSEFKQGGTLNKADLSVIKKKYDENEDENAHSENVVLLAKHFGSAEDLKEAKRILSLHNKEGHLTSENGKKRRALSQKLIDIARLKMLNKGIMFKEGGNILNNLSELRAGKPKAGSKLLFDLKYGDVYQIIKDEHTSTGEYFLFIDLDDKKYGISLRSKDFYDIMKGTIGSDKYIQGVQDGDIRILSREEAGAMLLNYKLNNNLFKKGGKTKPKDPVIVRGFADDEAYEYGKGGMAKYPTKIKKFATGSRISYESDETPKIWVGEWSLYNEGNLTGEWVDLSDFEDGSEVMDKIQALLDEWTKSTGELREEYAIFDFENFPSELYSEQMGEAEFDKIITAYKLSENLDIPMDVLASLMKEYDLDDENALEEFVNERYIGYFENNSELGEHLVEMYGGIEYMPKHTLEMYFDNESFGRDEAINSLNEYEGYYFYNN